MAREEADAYIDHTVNIFTPSFLLKTQQKADIIGELRKMLVSYAPTFNTEVAPCQEPLA